jgi:hypothetical protein
MEMAAIDLLPAAVWGAGFFAAIGMTVAVRRALRFPRPHEYSLAAGSVQAGVVYAFGKGMLPWAKESVRRHPISFIAGLAYHLAIALGFTLLFVRLCAWHVAGVWLALVRPVLLLGCLAGLGLAGKRAVVKPLRQLSCGDDFGANLLVDLFLAAAAFSLFSARGHVPFLVTAFVLLLYLPLGKIRHCFFFFWTRWAFGRFFGRRGVLPGPRQEASS